MPGTIFRLSILAALLCGPGQAIALDSKDIPAKAPNDRVMADAGELAAASRWISAVFAVKEPSISPPRVRLELRRQDHNVLRFGQSVIQTPLRIGKRAFKRGLGTHAHSEIVVTVPPGAKAFRALAGLDNNADTRRGKGSIQFAVEIKGKEVLRTATLRCGDEPVAVDIPIAKEVRRIVLKVDATADGTGWDQADWADAHILMSDGAVLWLDRQQAAIPLLVRTDPPFSFVYGRKKSSEIMGTWKRTVEVKDTGAMVRCNLRWTDPKTKLSVGVVAKRFKRYPAVDWVLYFENKGKQDTPIIRDIQPLDISLATGSATGILHGLSGDNCSAGSFNPFAKELRSGSSLRLAPSGGRPSNGAFPFFNFEYEGRGLFTAIGWSGQWAASFTREESGTTHLRAGMERTHLLLHPGERIRSPRVLLMTWQGDRPDAHNRFRRLLLHHYLPRDGEKPLAMQIFLQCYDRYRTHPKWRDEAGQLHAAGVAKALGCDFLWLDAAWFPGNFPRGVGNWSPKPKEFPNGLKPVSDACHKAGLKFMVWFEPERVAPGSEIAGEHPQFVFGGKKGGLFKLNDPAARKWLTGLLSRRITEFGMDWYRNDFNIDPLRFWRANDTPNRQGMTEIRYVEGHYAMWDELRARHPGLHIDNCASGGRRIDLETCMRSVPLWRSDTACRAGNSDWDQAQVLGMSLYLPLHQTCGWSPEPYIFRSAAGAGAIAQFAFLDKGFDLAEGKAAISEAKANQKYSYGDFYPLTDCTTKPAAFVAYQLHRPDLGAGMVMAFRRAECDVFGLGVKLGGLDPKASYRVEFIDEARRRTVRKMTAGEMAADFPLLIPKRRASLLVRYKLYEKNTK